MVSLEEVDNGIAVGNNITIKLPGAAERVFQQERIGARGLTIDAVIRAHNGLGFAFGYGRAERWQIRVFHIMFRDLDIDGVPRRFWTAVYRVVFRRGDHAEVFGIVALQSSDKSHAHSSR